MQINVTTRHGHLNEATQEKIASKAEKLLKFFERLSAIEIVVDVKDPQKPQVDVNVSAEHKHDFVSHGQGDNLIAAADSALSKMEQQLRRYKEKVQTRHRDNAGKRLDESPDADNVTDVGGEEDGEA